MRICLVDTTFHSGAQERYLSPIQVLNSPLNQPLFFLTFTLSIVLSCSRNMAAKAGFHMLHFLSCISPSPRCFLIPAVHGALR